MKHWMFVAWLVVASGCHSSCGESGPSPYESAGRADAQAEVPGLPRHPRYIAPRHYANPFQHPHRPSESD